MLRKRLFVVVAPLILAQLALPASADWRDGFPEGSAQIVDKRVFVGFDRPYRLMDLSSDGARVAFTTVVEANDDFITRVGLLDLTQDSLRFLLRSARSVDVAAFSPDDSSLLVRLGRSIWVRDLSSSESVKVARSLRGFQPIWLHDGRIAYLDPDRRLMFARPGEEPEYAGFTLPDPPRWDMLPRAAALSPSGDKLLYTLDCASRLLDLSTGEERLLGRRVVATHGSWAPDEAHFVLQRTPWRNDCIGFGPPPLFDILFAADGHRIGHVLGDDGSLSHGHGVTWSNDSRWLLLTDQPTGTAVGGFKMLHAVLVEERTRNVVVAAGMIDSPSVGPGDWIVYSQYHDFEGASRGNESGAVYVGKLVE